MNIQSTARKLSLAVLGVTAGMALNVQAERYGETIVSTSADGIRTAKIAVGDININTEAGFETLSYRVKNAAKMVCGPADFRRAGSLGQARDNRDCAVSAYDEAMSQASGSNIVSVSVSGR